MRQYSAPEEYNSRVYGADVPGNGEVNLQQIQRINEKNGPQVS
mgnify:CR=1 FL=1